MAEPIAEDSDSDSDSDDDADEDEDKGSAEGDKAIAGGAGGASGSGGSSGLGGADEGNVDPGDDSRLCEFTVQLGRALCAWNGRKS
jgi:hypothetical protein